MNKLQNLRPHGKKMRAAKVLGRGNGSGKGTYSGRGFKGQTARSGGNIKPGFEGGQTPITRRIPKYRGFNNINRIAYQVINVSDLNVFNDGEKVTITELFEKELIRRKDRPVKVLGNGELTKKLTIEVDRASDSALEKIEKAKGTVKQMIRKTA